MRAWKSTSKAKTRMSWSISGFGNLLLQRGLVEGVVDFRQARRVSGAVGVGDGIGAGGRLVGADEGVVVGAGDRRLMGAVVIDADADAGRPVRAVRIAGGKGNAHLLADMQAVDVDQLATGRRRSRRRRRR